MPQYVACIKRGLHKRQKYLTINPSKSSKFSTHIQSSPPLATTHICASTPTTEPVHIPHEPVPRPMFNPRLLDPPLPLPLPLPRPAPRFPLAWFEPIPRASASRVDKSETWACRRRISYWLTTTRSSGSMLWRWANLLIVNL